MTRIALPALAAALATLTACAPHTVIPDEERLRVSTELDGRGRYLRVAAYAAPFFGDSTRYLLTDEPVDEVQLLESASGQKIPPPPLPELPAIMLPAIVGAGDNWQRMPPDCSQLAQKQVKLYYVIPH